MSALTTETEPTSASGRASNVTSPNWPARFIGPHNWRGPLARLCEAADLPSLGPIVVAHIGQENVYFVTASGELRYAKVEGA